MAIVTGLTKKVDIPHEEGQWIIIRQLSWRQREKASDSKTDSVLARVKSMGVDLMHELRGAEKRADVKAALADPAASYDRSLVLQFGIVDWSYGKFAPEIVDDLDEITAAWAVEQILAFSGPASEEEAKNDS